MASWQRSGGLLFESVEARDVSIGLSSTTEAAISRFGGPVATYDTSTRMVRIFAGGGKLVMSCIFPHKLCAQGGFGWTEDLALTFVCDDDEGSVYIWDDFIVSSSEALTAQEQSRPNAATGPRKLKVKFGHKIHLVTFWNSGIVVLTAKFSVLVMKDLRSSPNIKWAAVSFPIVSLPRSLAVLRPFSSIPDSQVEIAVALPDQAGMLVASPERKSVDARVPQFRALPSRFMVPHPTESIIATLDVNDRLLIVNHTWEEILYARDCDLGSDFSEEPPLCMNWCIGGPGHCVVVFWPKTPWALSSPSRGGGNSFDKVQDDGNRGVEEEETSRFSDLMIGEAAGAGDVIYGPGMLVLGSLSNSSSPVAIDDIANSSQSSIVARFSLAPSGERMPRIGSAAAPRIITISEIDGLRILVNGRTFFLRRVSKATQVVDAIGSIAPAALLMDSLQQESSPESTIGGVTSSLVSSMDEEDLISAVDDLLEASKFELSFEKKLTMLRACLIGKDKLQLRIEDKSRLARKLHAFSEFYRGTQFLYEERLTTATTLEILQIGVYRFLSRLAFLGFTKQARALAPILSLMVGRPKVIEMARDAFPLIEAQAALRQKQATTISSLANVLFTNSRTSSSTHSNAIGNDAMASNLFQRCEAAPSSLSLYCASSEKEFAVKLSDYESNIANKLLTLLALNETDRVIKLVEMSSKSLDFDVKARTILHCMNKLGPEEADLKFSSNVVCEPIVRACFRSSRNAMKLEKWLLTCSSNKGAVVSVEKRHRASCERAFLLLETCLYTSDIQLPVTKKLIFLQEIIKEFDLASKPFYANQAREFLQLVQIQQKELNMMTALMGKGTKSLASTITDCIARGKDDLAEKLRKQFYMKPLLYWKCKLRGAAKRQMLFEFYKVCALDKEASRHVRLEEILDLCFEIGADTAASKIAFDLPDTNMEKPRTFVKLRMWLEALKYSQTSRCLDSTQDIILKCRDVQTVSRANVLLEELRTLGPISGQTGEGVSSDYTGDASGSGAGLLGLVTGAVNQPQRCQQQ